MINNLQIKKLADHPEAITTLKKWFEQECAQHYGPDGLGDAERDLLESCNRSKLPIALVALSEYDICGTASLKTQSIMTHTHLTPWLAALQVGAGFRSRGVDEQLIAAIEETARQLGFDCIYVGTGKGSDMPETPLRKRNWEFVGKSPYFDSEVSIFRKAL